MDNKTQPSKIYIAININHHGNDQEEYTLDEEIDWNKSQRWKEEFFVVKLFHTVVDQYVTNSLESDQRYYVNMPQSPTLIEE